MSRLTRSQCLGRLTAIVLVLAATVLLALPASLAAEEKRDGDPASTPTRTVTATPSSNPAAATPTPAAAEAAVTDEPTVDPQPAPDRPPVYPLAVMVDNFPSARPQTGLGSADIVYEALAEGGISRFLAIFTAPDPGLVGPVRSARHYYVYWAAEYNAPIVHILASDEGYAAIAHTGLPDLDEWRGDPGFHRSTDRPMPFNAYTSPGFDRQILADYGALWPGSLGGLERQPPARVSRGARVADLDIAYPIADYRVSWSYDRVLRRFRRSQAGGPHLDAATGQQIEAATVVVQFVPAWEHVERGGERYLDMDLVGAGRAVFFQHGLAVEGAWHKPSLGDYTRYLGPDGEAISFRPGPIWVQIVPTGPLEGQLTYTPLRPQQPLDPRR